MLFGVIWTVLVLLRIRMPNGAINRVTIESQVPGRILAKQILQQSINTSQFDYRSKRYRIDKLLDGSKDYETFNFQNGDIITIVPDIKSKPMRPMISKLNNQWLRRKAPSSPNYLNISLSQSNETVVMTTDVSAALLKIGPQLEQLNGDAVRLKYGILFGVVDDKGQVNVLSAVECSSTVSINNRNNSVVNAAQYLFNTSRVKDALEVAHHLGLVPLGIFINAGQQQSLISQKYFNAYLCMLWFAFIQSSSNPIRSHPITVWRHEKVIKQANEVVMEMFGLRGGISELIERGKLVLPSRSFFGIIASLVKGRASTAAIDKYSIRALESIRLVGQNGITLREVRTVDPELCLYPMPSRLQNDKKVRSPIQICNRFSATTKKSAIRNMFSKLQHSLQDDRKTTSALEILRDVELLLYLYGHRGSASNQVKKQFSKQVLHNLCKEVASGQLSHQSQAILQAICNFEESAK